MQITLNPDETSTMDPLPTCPHAHDAAHDRWDCQACQLTEALEAIFRACDGMTVGEVLAVLGHAHLTVLAQHVENMKGRSSQERRHAAHCTLEVIATMSTVGVAPFIDTLVPPPEVPMPSRVM